jgi:hypothetical protein
VMDRNSRQVVDLGADFMNFRWFDEDEWLFQFNDKNGTTLGGTFNRDGQSLRLETAWGQFAHFDLVRDDSPAANVPEPGSLLLAIPGIAWVFALRRRRNEAKK